MGLSSEDKSPRYKYLKTKCIIFTPADIANENYNGRNMQDLTRRQEKILIY